MRFAGKDLEVAGEDEEGKVSAQMRDVCTGELDQVLC